MSGFLKIKIIFTSLWRTKGRLEAFFWVPVSVGASISEFQTACNVMGKLLNELFCFCFIFSNRNPLNCIVVSK